MSDYNDRLLQMALARYKRFKRMLEKGMTYKEIAALENCTRQRVNAIVKRFDKRESTRER